MRDINVCPAYKIGKSVPTKRTRSISGDYKSPGPAFVTLPSIIGASDRTLQSRHKTAPKYTIPGRPENTTVRKTDGPGPCNVNISSFNQKGKINPPAFKLGVRYPLPISSATPGPTAYLPDSSPVTRKPPAFVVGTKLNQLKGCKYEWSPSPNMYNLRAPPSGPAFTIFGKKTNIYDTDAPGPGAYDINDSMIKKRAPSFSFKPRIPLKYKSVGPGPIYSREKMLANKSEAPVQSFGIKHSEYVGRTAGVVKFQKIKYPC